MKRIIRLTVLVLTLVTLFSSLPFSGASACWDPLESMIYEGEHSYYSYCELRRLNAFELRVLRNAPYAKNGKAFKTAALADYFSMFCWYYPDYRLTDRQIAACFNRFERENVDLIVRVEMEKGYR